jgi:hypothetical protein
MTERHRLGYGERDQDLMLVAIPETFEDCQRVVVSAVRLYRFDEPEPVVVDLAAQALSRCGVEVAPVGS